MNIIITGAGKGIGYSVVKKFAENKNNTIYALSRNIKQIENLCELGTKGKVIPISFDLNKIIEGDHTLNDLIEVDIDILINNAGYLINKDFMDFTPSEINQIFNINFVAPSLLIQRIFKKLNPKGAHIVNIGSMGGFQGSDKFSGLTFYSSSKAAIACFTECLATEFKSTNHRINCLALGSVQTEMLEQAFPEYKAPVTPDEIASFIVDFAINGSKFINGKIIPVALTNP